MTYFKTALASAAALALAAPAFAAEGPYKKDTAEMEKTTVVTVDGETQVMGAVDVNDTVGEILQSDGELMMDGDEEMIVMDDLESEEEFRTLDDDSMVADNAIVVPGSAGTLSTVTCPPGTTAQVDMTCLITGDYTPMN